MAEAMRKSNAVRFGVFEVDLCKGELRKSGVKLKLGGQPLQVLTILLERPGEVVTREELHKQLWAEDTFVDFEHGLNAVVNRIRDVLGDSPDSPRFIETIPRHGYRFIAPVEGSGLLTILESGVAPSSQPSESVARRKFNLKAKVLSYPVITAVAILLVAGSFFFIHNLSKAPELPRQRTLTRLTFDDGLQFGTTWSPDSRFIAYSSERGGKFDIWVRPVNGGDPVQVTHGPSHNWQPDWSPNGKYIAYRSEEDGGGIYVVPALGGVGLPSRIASMGYYPRWSPDGSRILFRTTQYRGLNRFYVVGLDGGDPREVLTQFQPHGGFTVMAAAWHPDGNRISVWLPSARVPDFWTVSLAGGAPIRSEFTAAVDQQLKEAGFRGLVEWVPDFEFSWSPSGRAIYCALTFEGTVNLWKMTIDPPTLRITAAERLTTGPGPDGGIGLSADGRRLAFTAESQHIWAWLFPFDAGQGKVKGMGEAESPGAIAVWRLSLSPDGKKVAFAGNRSGRSEVWQHSLLDTSSTPVMADDRFRDTPRWSRDGEHLVYLRLDPSRDDAQLIYWSAKTRSERLISDGRDIELGLDWLHNDREVLVSQRNPATHHFEIRLIPVPGRSDAGGSGRSMIFDPTYDLYQPSVSADGRWIAFQAVRDLHGKLESTICATRTTGGPWIGITNGKHWDDKPRWSPDGKVIYFISGRSGFFNVWAIHFDPSRGDPIGIPFAVTNFDNPSRMMPEHEPSVDLSVTQNKLLLTLQHRSGSIWMLDGVDQ